MALNIKRKPGTVGKSSGDAKHKIQGTPNVVIPPPIDDHHITNREMEVHQEAAMERKKLSSASSDIRNAAKPTWHEGQQGATATVAFVSSTTKNYKEPPVARVVNIRKAELNKRGIKDLEKWVKDPNNIYIGRDMTCYVKGAVGSKWHNPFKSKKLGREESVKLYEEHIRSSPSLMAQLDELKGKCLGCWCHPLSCHGHVLVKLLKEKIANESK